ncbi:MAG: glucose-6-phosphate dehydrogenase, partial [Armatimonadetes bacterium]|nr:glucose-6-phosphate dehydrogenase [Armatimonadota bacterium]
MSTERNQRGIDPHLFVIVGGTGDLTRRKLLPALYHLSREGYLHEQCRVLGVARRGDFDDIGYQQWAQESLASAGVKVDDAASAWCCGRLHFHRLDQGEATDYQALADRILSLEREHNLPGNRVFNLAIPPDAFAATVEGLAAAGLTKPPGWIRLLVEKPFGHDYAS